MKNSVIILFSFISLSLCAQTYSEIQTELENSRLKILENKLSKVEEYAYKDARDSTIKSISIYDTHGNIINARHYHYKKKSDFDELTYIYDNTGRIITRRSRGSFMDIAHDQVQTITEYSYKKDSLIKILYKHIRGDSVQSIIEHTNKQIDYLLEKVEITLFDTLGNKLVEEYDDGYDDAVRIEYTYDDKGNNDSRTVYYYLFGRKFSMDKYNSEDQVIESFYWNPNRKNSKPKSHAVYTYNEDGFINRIDYLNKIGGVKSYRKYYYFKF